MKVSIGQVWECFDTTISDSIGDVLKIEYIDSSWFYCSNNKVGNKDFLMDKNHLINHFKLKEDVSDSEKPEQYNLGIDTFKRCEANMNREEILTCVRFNIDKYNWRKKGQDKEDFVKIIKYSEWALKNLD